MIVLLLGLTVLVGAFWMAGRDGGRASAWWVVPVAVLVVGQVWLQRERLSTYHVRLLQQRFRVESLEVGAGLEVSGDRDSADVYVPGAGQMPVVTLDVLEEEGSVEAVSVHPSTGRSAVALVRTRRGWRGGEWMVLRSQALRDGDVIGLGPGSEDDGLVFRRRRPGLRHKLGLTGTRDELVPRYPVDDGVDGAVRIPYPEGAGVAGLFPRRPSVFQRTYPIADLIAPLALGGADGVALRSFIYYRGGNPRIALLDDGLRVVTPESGTPVAEVPVWTRSGGSRLLSVSGLPHRDFPEAGLSPVERYGIRPLRSLRVTVEDGWVGVSGPRAEVHAVAMSQLAPGRSVDRSADGRPLHPIRLSTGSAGGDRADVSLSSLPEGFAAAVQSVLRLPDDPMTGWFELLTPSGLARWDTGRPFTIGDGSRGLLLRVDGFGLSVGLAAALAALFLLAAVPFLASGVPAPIRGLAYAALGLAGLRFLASLSAMVRYPYVSEGHQISLWLIAAAPWIVVGAARAFEAPPRSPVAGAAVVRRGFSGGFMGEATRTAGFAWRARLGSALAAPRVEALAAPALALTLAWLALVLFQDSPVKAVTLGLASLGVAAIGAGRDRRLGDRAVQAWHGLRSRPGLPGGAWSGAVLGAVLLLSRILLDLAGFREQVSLGGTRLGLSVLYTPAALICFALVLAGHDRRVWSATSGAGRVVARAWLDLWAFILLAFVLAAVRISDFGIVLTTLPGPLLVLGWAGWSWSKRVGGRAVLGGALPLALFLLIQIAPELARPSMTAGAEVTSRMEDWSRNELLLLERGDPDALKLIGESRSEALAVMRETMRSYTRGNWVGKGFLAGRVSPELRATAAREHVVTGLVASQWGLTGTLGLMSLLAAVLVSLWGGGGLPPSDEPGRNELPEGRGPRHRRPVIVALLAGGGALLPSPASLVVVWALLVAATILALAPILPRPLTEGVRRLWPEDLEGRTGDQRNREPTSPARWISVTMLVAFVATGVYMTLANYGLVLFTGKNVYLLGLDSLGDTVEGLALLSLGGCAAAYQALAAARSESREPPTWVLAEPSRLLPDRRRVG